MSPTLNISQNLYYRLEKHAKGFDTPEQVIERLLDNEGAESEQLEIPPRKPMVPRKRDVTKYSFNRHEYGKGRLVLAVVLKLVQQRNETSYDDLLSAWPKSLQGSLGVFAKIDEPELDHKRYFFKSTEQVVLSDCIVAVCNQWGKDNIGNFLGAAKSHKFDITEIVARYDTSRMEEQVIREKTLRGLVIQMWREAGRPTWGYSETSTACLEANDDLQVRGLNPAKKFREKVEEGDDVYLESWVRGCHFDWLNPR